MLNMLLGLAIVATILVCILYPIIPCVLLMLALAIAMSIR